MRPVPNSRLQKIHGVFLHAHLHHRVRIVAVVVVGNLRLAKTRPLERRLPRQLETLGLDDLLTPDALVVVEWGEKFKSIRKRATGEILIASAGGDARKITVTLKE